MSDRAGDHSGNGSPPRGPRKGRPGPAGGEPGAGGRPRQPARGPARGGKRPGSLRLARIAGNDFELAHPPCVHATEPDYEEGIEIWKAGDPEGARDALRYALAACRDNLWIHAALGRIALEEFRDPALARGHFGYAVELVQKAIDPAFAGRLPRERAANRSFYDAVDGLIQSLEALGRQGDAAKLSGWRDRLARGRS